MKRNTSKRKTSTVIPPCISAAVVAISVISTAQASVSTWAGNTSANFNASNWSGLHNPPVTGDSWFFGAAGTSGTTLNNDLTAAISVAGITFDVGASAFILGGNSITLAGDVTNNGIALETINTAIATTAVRTITTSGGGGDIAVGGNITGTGGGIIKSGSGTLTLSGVNGYTGTTTVNAGILSVSGSGNLGTGALTLNGGTLLFTGSATLRTTQTIAIGTAAASTIDTGTNTVLLAGGANVLTGSGSLTKTGSGTLDLNNSISASNFTGNLSILNGSFRAGRYFIAANISLGDTSGTNNASLEASSASATWPGNIVVNAGSSGTKTIAKVINTGIHTMGGTLTLNDNVTLSNNSATGSLSFSNTISGSGNITIANNSSARTVTLSGSNTFTGTTKMSSANSVLVIGNNDALKNSALDTIGGGFITITGFTTPTLGGLSGSTNLATVISTGYSGITSLTLNPVTGKNNSYSGSMQVGGAWPTTANAVA